MAVGQIEVCLRLGFPWALPKARLTMAVGQIVGWWGEMLCGVCVFGGCRGQS